jgi:hypothetical protein
MTGLPSAYHKNLVSPNEGCVSSAWTQRRASGTVRYAHCGGAPAASSRGSRLIARDAEAELRPGCMIVPVGGGPRAVSHLFCRRCAMTRSHCSEPWLSRINAALVSQSTALGAPLNADPAAAMAITPAAPSRTEARGEDP